MATERPDGVPIPHLPIDASDFLSSAVPKVNYPEPLDLGEGLGKLLSDPAGPSLFDDEDEA